MSLNLEALGERVRTEQDACRSTVDRERVKARLLEHEAAPRARLLPRGLAWLGAAAALAVVLWAGAGSLESRAPLQVSVGGQVVVDPAGRFWSADSGGKLPLEFSDGSLLELGAGSRARITGLTAKGAAVTLETGHASVQVAQRPGASWSFTLGPFRVEVLGTEFDLSWQPERDAFELTLHHGSLRLSGCMFEAGRNVIAGETVSASCKEGRVESVWGKRRSEEQTHAARPTPQTAELAPAREGGPRDTVASAPLGQGGPRRAVAPSGQETHAGPKQPSAPSTEDWRALAEQHQYAAAYRALEQRGLEAEAAGLSAAELLRLADVLRYAGKSEKAEFAYALLRRKFGGSPEAKLGAYSLAKVAFDQRGDYATASRWLYIYLDEAPEGSLAREALGRLMNAEHRLGRVAEARALARRYLSAHPTGPGAAQARQLLSE